jgi:hypothetical protein
MKAYKIGKFMQLAGQPRSRSLTLGTEEQRKLGARLLLSEVLEYVIHGLGVEPEIDGVRITRPDDVNYAVSTQPPNRLEMVDGLADVAYTMYWNACAFGIPLEEAFDLVCDNNLDKFVKLESWPRGQCPLEREEWHCDKDIRWPDDVVKVEVIRVGEGYFAVGKDSRGKVRKPSSYTGVDLTPLLDQTAN